MWSGWAEGTRRASMWSGSAQSERALARNVLTVVASRHHLDAAMQRVLSSVALGQDQIFQLA
jgi:hypothetical protein